LWKAESLIRVSLIFSYDNGVRWDTAHPKVITGTMTQELGIAWAGNNQIIAFDRPSTNRNLILLHSNDMGSTWTSTTTNIAAKPTPQGWSVAANGQALVSPWLTKPSPDLGDGSITLFYAERDNWNDPSVQHVYNYLRAITFRPQDAIANPTSFGVPQDIYAQTPPVTGFVNFGYPTVVQISGNTLLVEFYRQMDTSHVNLVNLYTMTVQYQTSQADFTLSVSPLTPASVAWTVRYIRGHAYFSE